MTLGIISTLIGYLLGSFPSAYVITKIRKGVDIRSVDVGNMGAAATIRQAGLIFGLVVAILDIAKGAGTILIAQNLFNVSNYWLYTAGFAALLGHCYPLYIGFKGGQGIATIIGVFSVLTPNIMLIILPLMALALLILRRIFPMICIVAPFFPLTIWYIYGSFDLLAYSLLIVTFMSYRNRKGIHKEIIHFIKKFKDFGKK